MISTFGAPFGARFSSYGVQSAFESRTSSLITPLNVSLFMVSFQSADNCLSRSLEPEPQADDDGERQAGAVVVDLGEAGAHERIDVRQPADVAQPELRRQVHLLRDLEDHAAAERPRERAGRIVEVGVVEDEVGLRGGELHVDPVDERDADRRFAERAEVALGERKVPAHAEIEPDALVVRVLTVQVRRPDVAEPDQVGVRRLVGERAAQLGALVQQEAGAAAQLDAGAVDLAVRVRQDRGGLSLQHADRARVDVAVDAAVDADADVDAPARLRCLCPRVARAGEQRPGDDRVDGDVMKNAHALAPVHMKSARRAGEILGGEHEDGVIGRLCEAAEQADYADSAARSMWRVALQQKRLDMMSVRQAADARPTSQASAAVKQLTEMVPALERRSEDLRR